MPHRSLRWFFWIGLNGFILPVLASTSAPIINLDVGSQAITSSQHTQSYLLENGLKLIVRPDDRAPVVVSQIWYKVGSSMEAPNQTGLSHVLEHMMFKGTPKVGPGEASRVLRDLGAQENAFTSDDYTAYYQVIAKDRLPVAFELEADRMRHLSLPEDEFKRELEVVKEERRLRTEDNPTAFAYERFKAQIYLSSGYRNPTIGWSEDLNRMTLDDLRNWYQSWYAPNNATLVVVGDVIPVQVKQMAEKFFGAIPRRALPTSKVNLNIANSGERRLNIQVKSQLPMLMMAFNVPSMVTAENRETIYALRMITVLLDGGYGARLATNLERKQALVTQAQATYDAFNKGDSHFMISAQPNQENKISMDVLEKALWKEIKTLQDTPPSEKEMQRMRAQLTAEMVFEKDSIEEQASFMGVLESIGLDWTLADHELSMLKKVTPQQILETAQRFFTPERLSVAWVMPTPKP